MCNNPSYILRVENWSAVRSLWLARLGLSSSLLKKSVSVMRDCLELWCTYEQYKFYLQCGIREEQFLKIPCRKCLGCSLDRKNQWASRCLIESKKWDSNLFVTLTYDEKHVPPELCRKDFQDFMKRLREWCSRNGKPSPRVYYRGEYGERTYRPHFHAILFNFSLEDLRVLFWKTKRGKKVYHAEPGAVPYSTSPSLVKLWRNGNVIIASVTLETIKYTANYLDKGQSAVQGLIKPFNGMSTRPAIAKWYYDEHLRDYFKHGRVVSIKVPSPSISYYNRKMKEEHPLYYNLFLQKTRSVVAARDKPWEKLGMDEREYLQRREEKLQAIKRKFAKKDEATLFCYSLTLATKRLTASPVCGNV